MDFSSSPRQGVTFKGHYETLYPLNHGSFGVVFLARDLRSGKYVALKCLKKASAGPDFDPYLKVDEKSEELGIHSRIGFHPNVVNLLDYFETRTHTYLVLEYCAMGDLYEAIRTEKGPRETEHVRYFMLQLISAIEHLHFKGIYHRDIKPENIFLTSNGTVKLGDFGLATADVWSDEIAVGSDRYMAPEQYDPNGNGLSPAKADIWSIGICLLNILFAKNPFAVPSLEDPLFTDFVRDRQSLFDVFPTMSQDTFDILGHCLALDPEKRSLSALRQAIQRAVSFTTDDESLDEFCRDSRNIPQATEANREPLRTPSITSPNLDNGGNFPWAKALMASPPVVQPRQLSAIPDVDTRSEELFPGSEISTADWSSKADTRSIESVVDSGLGLSIGSTNTTYQDPTFSRSKPVPIAGSLPTMGSKPGKTFSSIFGKKKIFESKSWSDMLDEDEEDDDDDVLEMSPVSRRPTPLPIAQLSQDDSDSDGHSTPRAILTEIKSSATLNAREINDSVFFKSFKQPQVSQFTGFVFEDNHPALARHATPTKQQQPSKRSLMDKWAALGDRRRATTPTKETAPINVPKTDPPKSRFRDGNWKRNLGLQRPKPNRENDVWQRKEWAMSTDWRRSEKDLSKPSFGHGRPPASQLDGAFESDASADESETEFIGRLEDLHT